LVSKDIKAGDIQVKELTDVKKRMIKKFVVDYMNKVISRQGEKRLKKEAIPSDSVSTGTPQVPASTPRDQKEMEPDKAVVTPESDEDERSLSPMEVEKNIEMDGLGEKQTDGR
jgi:hypothetical protein